MMKMEVTRDLIDKDIFTYYKGYLFNGTLIINNKDSKLDISMRFGLKHGDFKKYNKAGELIESKKCFNDVLC